MRSADAPLAHADSIFAASTFRSPQKSATKSRQVFLLQQAAAQHVADEQCIHLFRASLLQRRCNRMVGDMADRQIPVFAHRYLTDSNYRHIAHIRNPGNAFKDPHTV